MPKKLLPFYDLDAAVGPGCPNRPDDVMLVQSFLNCIRTHGNLPSKPLNKRMMPGAFDAATGELIVWFQSKMQLAQEAGVVAPAGAPGQWTTIVALNREVRRLTQAGFSHLEAGSTPRVIMPAALQGALRQNRKPQGW